MREIIQSVLAAEAEAKALVAAARQEADRILSEAQAQSREQRATAAREARLEAQRVIDGVVEQAVREQQERLAEAAASIETGIDLDGSTRQAAVAAAVGCIVLATPQRTEPYAQGRCN